MIYILKEHYMIVWFILLFTIEFFIHSKNLMKKSRWNAHWVTNLTNHLATYGIGLLLFIPAISFAVAHPLTHIVSSMNIWVAALFTIIVMDFAGYWFHRFCHENEYLWRVHEIHHLDEFMDVTTGLRVHFMERFFHTLVDIVLIMSLGLPAYGIILHSAIAFIISTYHHSRLTIPYSIEKSISYIITTPKFHEPHHDHLIDNNNTNYSFIFPIWDRIFNTYHPDTFSGKWTFGLIYCKDIKGIDSLLRPFKKIKNP